jgi:hypothetical protein
MPIHEGLSGLVAEEVRPVAVEQVKNHPRFKYFREAGEDAYQSFLGVPLIDRGVLQGVLIVQTVDPRVFREDEIRMLMDAAGQGTDIAVVRRRRAHANPPGAIPWRGRFSRLESDGNYAQRCSYERRPQRICGDRGNPESYGG